MAECSNGNLERDIVKCGICLSAFTKPVLLSCFHIFCTPCVTKLTEGKDTLICPLCRAVQVLPNNGVDGLTLYPFTQDAGPPDTNVMVLCQMCDNDIIAVSNCIDCNSKMCLQCSAYHLKHKIFKTHKTEKIEIECTEIEATETKMSEDDTCKSHKEELTLLCESCNRAICNECIKQNHRYHKLEPITFPAKKRRDFLQSAISALKSKITAINQKKEISKFEENIYYKLCRQGKEEIRTHSKRSKDTVCQIIDILTDINLQEIDKMQKQDIKSINNHQDELETITLSLQCLLRSSEDIVNLSRDGKLFNDYAFLYQTLLSAVTQDNEFVLFAPQFCSGHPIEHKYVEKCFGIVSRGKRPSIASESKTHIHSLPFICKVTKFTKVTSLNTPGTKRLFGICENKALIHVAQRKKTHVNLYSAKDSDPILGYNVEMKDGQHILRATQTELWVKLGPLISVMKITEGTCTRTEEIVQMHEFVNVACSVLDDNRIIAYSVNNKCFYEVKTDGV
ncbi:tripartite motif-containing protein 45-like [Mytilus californianus]|uniref:tripartite motif-containing protein 45-like n=1 Tax=Mytilus californianus TaxID=6549 RepID=UPI0022478DCB|nr:tripartite motif-containing protein 45-like [Mytilus californianus]